MIGCDGCAYPIALLTAFGSVIPQPTEWQRVGNQIDAAFIFARTDCVNMHSGWLQHMVSRDAVIALICPPPVLAAFFL